MNPFSINVTSNDTDEISEDVKVKFVNRNKNSSKCVAKQVGTLETPCTVPEIFSKTKYAKSYKSGAKGISNKKLLSPIGMQLSATELSNNYMKKRSSAKICSIAQSNPQSSLFFKRDNEGQFEKVLEDCFKKGVDFEEAMTILKAKNLMEEMSDNGESKNKTSNIHVKSEYYEDFSLDNYTPGCGNDWSNNLTDNLKQSNNTACDTYKNLSKNTAITSNSNDLGSSNKCSSSSITDNLNNSDCQTGNAQTFKLNYIKNVANHAEESYDHKSIIDQPYAIAINDTKISSHLEMKEFLHKSTKELYQEDQQNHILSEIPNSIEQSSNKQEIDKDNGNNNDFTSDVSD